MPTVLEQTMPSCDVQERHSRFIDAAPAQVWAALTTLRLDELRVARALMAVRHPRGGAPERRPLFEDGPVTMLATTPGRYAIGASIGRPWQRDPDRVEVTSLDGFAQFAEPGWVKVLTDFDLVPHDGGVTVTTTTRCCSTDQRSRRIFGLYWIAIRLFSGIVRRDMLATTARRVRV